MRVGLGLLSLAILLAVVAGLTIWYIRANRVTATAMFHIASVTPAVLADEPSIRRDERNYHIIKKSQLAALRSEFVLLAALRKPGIAALPTFASVDDPVEWLRENLEVEYPEDGEYLVIGLSGPTSQSDELVMIVDAVAKAYQNEVVYKDKARLLAERDLLSRKLDQLKKDIAQKTAEFYEGAQSTRFEERDSGNLSNHSGVILLDQIGPRKQRPKSGQSGSEIDDGAAEFEFDKQLIDKLPEQRNNEQKREFPGDRIAKFNERKRELLAFEKIAAELTEKLKKLDMEDGIPSRIQQVQQAVIEEQ